jgi:hypothetical protein
MKRLAGYALRLYAYLAPLAALASLGSCVLGYGGAGWLLFLALGFTGMFALSISNTLLEGVRGGAEVQQCVQALEELEVESANLAFGVVKPQVLQLISDEAKTVHSIKNDGLVPRSVVALLLTNVIQAILPTGQHHIYRGTLSGIGQQLLALWDFCIRELESSGYHSAAEAAKDRAWIREQIRDCG